MKKPIIIIVIILLIDQISKIYIKTHFVLHEEIEVMGLDWFKIHFLENNGMAWGTEFGGENGKLYLTLFRLVAITGIGYWLWSAIKSNAHKVLITAIAFIFAGALGNIIDSVFYGILFEESTSHNIAAFLPESGGYSSIFHGKVVDMLHFPFIKNGTLPSWVPSISFVWPDWLPFIGGDLFTLFVDRSFSFFDPVFNIADMAISTGVGILLVFNKKAFPKKEEEEETHKIVPPIVVQHYEKPKA